MLKKDRDGKRNFSDHLFVGLDDDPENVGVTIFSPNLREQSFLARKQEYLRNVESVIGLKRGLLSEVEAQERTAKEITSSEGDYNLTVIDFQGMWERAVQEAVRLCGVLGRLYNVPSAHEAAEDAVTIDWGNGVLYDEEKTWANYMQMVSAGCSSRKSPWAGVLTCQRIRRRNCKESREKYMPDAFEDGE